MLKSIFFMLSGNSTPYKGENPPKTSTAFLLVSQTNAPLDYKEESDTEQTLLALYQMPRYHCISLKHLHVHPAMTKGTGRLLPAETLI